MKFYLYMICICLSIWSLNAQNTKSTESNQDLNVVFKKITGTGQTTGHIADLTINNNSKNNIDYKVPQMFIPSSGKYQPYIVPNVTPVNLGPNETKVVPIYGYCADIHMPPVPINIPIPVQNIISLPDLKALVNSSVPAVPITLQGTGNIKKPIDFNKDPVSTGNILLGAIQQIEKAYDHLKESESISTPFYGNPEKERESVIQQTFWLYTSGIQQKEYDKDQFKENTIKQYNTSMPTTYENSTEQQKQNVEKGVDDFWNSFVAVGVDAKVLTLSDKTTAPPEKIKTPPPPPENVKEFCTSDLKVKCVPVSCYDINIKIADSYGDEKERKEIIESIKNELAKKENTDEQKKDSIQYSLKHPPASAIALYEENHIGGFTSAFAKSSFKKSDGSTEVVWSTQPLEVTAKGSKEATLSFKGGSNCTCFVSGVSLARVKATSKCFDAVAGNDPNSLFVLKLLNEAGSIAIDIIISKGKGTAKKIGDIIGDKAKDYAKDKAKEEVENLFGDKIRKFAKEQGIDIDDVDFSEVELPGDEEGIEIIDIIPMSATVKAEGKGTLTTTVGGNTKTADAYSGAFYNREKLEDKDKTVKITGPACKEVMVSDSKPCSLTVKVNGVSNMKSQAEGNGFAEANIESMYAVVMFGICICDGQYIWDSYTDYGYYLKDNSTYGAVNFEEIGNITEEIGKDIDSGKLEKTQQAVQKALENAMIKWSNDHPLVWENCK